mmetsp:Transcript_14583/g.24716  ORF Transcript_14583/g.24716 Transcript_14583/m.24716 type:complete len:331 (-) Transcript_14583:506-1498(-)
MNRARSLVGHGLREAGADAGVGLAVHKSPLLHREVPVRVPWELLLQQSLVPGLSLEARVLLPVPHCQRRGAAHAIDVHLLAHVRQNGHPLHARGGGAFCVPEGVRDPFVKGGIERVHFLLQHLDEDDGPLRLGVAAVVRKGPRRFVEFQSRMAVPCHERVRGMSAESVEALVLPAQVRAGPDVLLIALCWRVVEAHDEVMPVDLLSVPRPLACLQRGAVSDHRARSVRVGSWVAAYPPQRLRGKLAKCVVFTRRLILPDLKDCLEFAIVLIRVQVAPEGAPPNCYLWHEGFPEARHLHRVIAVGAREGDRALSLTRDLCERHRCSDEENW